MCDTSSSLHICSRPKKTYTVYPKKYAHGFCFAVLCCGYTLADFPISIRLTSLALWQSNDCPSDSKATLMNMDKYFMWIHYERLHNHNKTKHNKTVCIFLGIYCMYKTTGSLQPKGLLHNSCRVSSSKTSFMDFGHIQGRRKCYFTGNIYRQVVLEVNSSSLKFVIQGSIEKNS